MSGERRQPPSPVLEHTHCLVCGRPVSLDRSFCSPECEHTFQRQRRRQRITSWIFLGVLLALMLLWVFMAGRSAG